MVVERGCSVGLQRVARWAVPLVGVALLVSGCSEEGKRLAMPDPASEQGEHVLALWQGAWIAALATGVAGWGLIFYVLTRFPRRSDDEIPVQARYSLPLEIFYAIAPVIMVVVFFDHTVSTQNTILKDDAAPDNIIEVTGQQWSWTFNYGLGDVDNSADDNRFDDKF